MQDKIKLLIIFALILLVSFFYYQQDKYKSTINQLLNENKELKQKDKTLNDVNLSEKLKRLESENRLLKDQVFQLEKEQFLFNSNEKEKYKLDDNLKFKDDTKVLKDKIADQNEEKKDDELTISPSIDFNTEKKEIEGVELKIETKF